MMTDRPPPPASTSDELALLSQKLPDWYAGPGALKEKRRNRHYPKARRHSAARFTELHLSSAFSFLEGSSLPEDLVQRAAELELPAVALTDRNGVYGAPRFFKAARQAGIKALVGSEMVLDPALAPPADERRAAASRRRQLLADSALRQRLQMAPPDLPRLTLLAESRTGYRNLCRLATAAAHGRAKGDAAVSWSLLEEHAAGLYALSGGSEGLLTRQLEADGIDRARAALERLAGLFPGRLAVEIQRHGLRHEEHCNQALIELARQHRLPLVATNGVRYARSADKPLYDLLTCLRQHVTLDEAGSLIAGERQRQLKSADQMARLFADLPQAVTFSHELGERLDFTLADLGYRFPDYPVDPGETLASTLRQVTWNAARARFRPLTARAQTQIAKELNLIEKLDLAGYFLIVWDIVRFCQRRGILAQGRGSAANSAVCYALSITAVDPVKMELLFERFLSEERGEWPDIDLDLPSGDRREEVIQYVYQRYGPHGAAMTANVITYRDRSAAREVAKVLGFSPEQVDRLAKQLGSFRYDASRGDPKSIPVELAAAGFDPESPRLQLFADLWQQIQNLPRHLGQHSGGMVIAAGRLDEVVPLEPASMEDRVVVQWDKDDCADLGIIKVDLLGLGMLAALEETVPTIHRCERVHVDLAHLPMDDPAVYRMLQQADTVGLFQVESRAQMASLPRNHPETFYDLVIQVAIIRPGPIVGGMVNPYFERRRGRAPVTYPHPSLEPVLARTLGIPLFQEQILRVAMVAAGFSGGEAEELRRAMGFKRSAERMHEIERRLRHGMTERGITGEAQEEIVRSITSFALYGFPESHAASFALIAYASAYLKVHHPTAFYVALLNAWPMGFYHPASLLQDARKRGVESRPIDVDRSGWSCRWEENDDAGRSRNQPARRPRGAIRLGLRYVKGLAAETGRRIEEERQRGAFRSVGELARRCRLRPDELTRLAHVGALASLGLTRRQALWQVAEVGRPAGPLLADLCSDTPSPLPEMTPFQEVVADFAGSGVTTGPHPMSFVRQEMERLGVTPAGALPALAPDRRVRIAGSVIVRQRPGTAKGLLFVTLEDETGMIQAIVMPDLFREHRRALLGYPGLIVEGTLQKRDGSLSVKAERLWPLARLEPVPSHDFH